MAEKLMKEFQQIIDNFSECFENDKIKELAEEFFTEDCRVMAPGKDVVIGREAVMDIGTSFKKAGVDKVKNTIMEIVPGGDDIATLCGSYTFYTKDGEVHDEGKVMVLWKRVNGRWLIYFDMFNSNKA